MVRQLNHEVVKVLGKELNTRACCVQVEVVYDIVSLSDNFVEELVCLAHLSVAGGCSIGGVSLSAEGVTEECLPWLILDGGNSGRISV